ncbi:MAG: phenylacetate--CoA ligase family protein [Acidobacteria bacterium]|nr:MAG: phenylacetate--CoA ligase family protein [Acidobacteriota bacterium]
MTSDWYTPVVSGVLFPFHERLKGHDTVQRLRALERSQWWTRERIAGLQRERLKQFLTRVSANVPYYRAVFERLGLDASAELETLPLLTKQLIRDNLEDLKSETAGVLTPYNTGGSTGEPLQFFMGKARKSHDVAAKWRATRWWGVDIGDPELVVWGSPVELGAQDRVCELRDRVFRTKLVSAFEMSEERLDELVRTIQRMRPRMLFGYPSSLALIAEHSRERGFDLSDAGVEVAFVTAEQLFEHQEEAIRQAFSCRVANGYGGRDFGFAAHECPEGGLHLSAEDILVEIVDRDGGVLPVGDEGEIVVTHLATSDFPFIRYRTGDVGVLSERACACGRGLPLLEALRGRTTDFIVAADGTVMHALALIYAIRDVPGVRNFKIVQEDLHHTRVLLVAETGFSDSKTREIENGLSQRLGSGVRITIERVDEIPTTRAGKHRYVESRVDVRARGVGARAPASSTPTP